MVMMIRTWHYDAHENTSPQSLNTSPSRHHLRQRPAMVALQCADVHCMTSARPFAWQPPPC
eukprot:6766103-Karenia_brevis.AAC.1